MWPGQNNIRCVVTFAVRDSPFDSINISLWGAPGKVKAMSQVFAIGSAGEFEIDKGREVEETDGRVKAGEKGKEVIDERRERRRR